MKALYKVYYSIRCFVPKRLQVGMRRCFMRYQRFRTRDIWPIDPKESLSRPLWNQWPDNKQFAFVLTHDVESGIGVENCEQLLQIDRQFGFRSSFNFVPERYSTPPRLRQKLKSEGFEVGVHGLLHDGKLYSSKHVFMDRAAKINEYLKAWGAVGFRSPSMHHNLEWLHALDVEYDLSAFDTDPFEPDNSGVGTIFPFWVPDGPEGSGYVELPYTLPQDSTLYLFLQEKTIDIWKQKLDWIVQQGGMALLNTHPDYMSFSSRTQRGLTYPSDFYRQFLEYVVTKYEGLYWAPLPREMAEFARAEHHAADHKASN